MAAHVFFSGFGLEYEGVADRHEITLFKWTLNLDEICRLVKHGYGNDLILALLSDAVDDRASGGSLDGVDGHEHGSRVLMFINENRHAPEHSRAKFKLWIGEHDPHFRGSTPWIENAADVVDLTFEVLARKPVKTDNSALPQLEFRDVALRHTAHHPYEVQLRDEEDLIV
jgi:hypothetical protein